MTTDIIENARIIVGELTAFRILRARQQAGAVDFLVGFLNLFKDMDSNKLLIHMAKAQGQSERLPQVVFTCVSSTVRDALRDATKEGSIVPQRIVSRLSGIADDIETIKHLFQYNACLFNKIRVCKREDCRTFFHKKRKEEYCSTKCKNSVCQPKDKERRQAYKKIEVAILREYNKTGNYEQARQAALNNPRYQDDFKRYPDFKKKFKQRTA